MASPELSIVIVNWNSKAYVRDCVASVLADTFGVEYEVIVVDSGSFDGCGEMLARDYPQVRFVQSDKNIGFGRANNLGASFARGETLLLLNPDTEVQGQAVERLRDSLRSLPHAGVVGCRLLNTDRSLQITCVQPFPTIANQVLNARILQHWSPKSKLWGSAKAFEGLKSPQAVEVIVGACMVMKRSVFESVGGFSADYFMYAEDADLCYKIHAQGLTNYYVPGIEVVHHGGGSTKQSYSNFSSVMMRESLGRLIRKIHGVAYYRLYRAAVAATAASRLILLVLHAPIALFTGSGDAVVPRFRKWAAVFRWSIGLETWVRDYDPPIGK